ncbi:helix-turn-helix domain-containing protein [Phenylobacterium sp. Root700]|uniref:helix-turn-helix domain-containing protein n=1 Tax=Phenylobacterium sp. Root700 TaxID=1736591 RepID=UPI0006F73C00|nr:helix-turn-helix transcriptional regulator [Phenylobacterium sp. Root700]KRB42054.1 DNA-binding protein [Phenylobacterium sp. Root700]
MISPAQIRMARAALGISVKALAERSAVADSTIHRFESNKGGMQTGTLDRIQAALEAEGVVFISADAQGGPGVRLKA